MGLVLALGALAPLCAFAAGESGREVFVSGLDVMSNLPESVSLFNNLVRWAEGEETQSRR